MPYGGSTANVGVWEEVESYLDLILREAGEIVNLAHRRSDVIKAVDSMGGLGEFGIDHERCGRHDLLEQYAHLGLLAGAEFSLSLIT